jgi:hypothetical protein
MLRKKIEQKIDKTLFETVTGVSIKSIFEAEERKDVWINAKQAKQLGIISKIKRLEKAEQLKMVAYFDESSNGLHDTTQGSGANEATVIEIDNLINNFKL